MLWFTSGKNTQMNTVTRVLLTFTSFFGAYVLCWILVLLIPLGVWSIVGSFVSLAIAIWIGIRVWRNSAKGLPVTPWGYAGYGAAVVGSVTFLLGFFGPAIFAPDGNHMAVLGTFFAGPVGALLGAIGGFIYSRRQAG